MRTPLKTLMIASALVVGLAVAPALYAKSPDDTPGSQVSPMTQGNMMGQDNMTVQGNMMGQGNMTGQGNMMGQGNMTAQGNKMGMMKMMSQMMENHDKMMKTMMKAHGAAPSHNAQPDNAQPDKK